MLCREWRGQVSAPRALQSKIWHREGQEKGGTEVAAPLSWVKPWNPFGCVIVSAAPPPLPRHHLRHTHLDRSCSNSWMRFCASQTEDKWSLSSVGEDVPSISQRSRRDFLWEVRQRMHLSAILHWTLTPTETRGLSGHIKTSQWAYSHAYMHRHTWDHSCAYPELHLCSTTCTYRSIWASSHTRSTDSTIFSRQATCPDIFSIFSAGSVNCFYCLEMYFSGDFFI